MHLNQPFNFLSIILVELPTEGLSSNMMNDTKLSLFPKSLKMNFGQELLFALCNWVNGHDLLPFFIILYHK